MIIKNIIAFKDFVTLVNFIDSPESNVTQDEVGGMILQNIGDGGKPIKKSQHKVVRFKEGLMFYEEGNMFGVTLEIDDLVIVENGRGGIERVPPRLLLGLLKALGSPLE